MANQVDLPWAAKVRRDIGDVNFINVRLHDPRVQQGKEFKSLIREMFQKNYGYNIDTGVPFLATVCPYEAESYSENGEDIVEGDVMPTEINEWVQSFVERFHVDQPFRKRKQKKAYDPRKSGFGRRGPNVRNVYDAGDNNEH